jgi:mRNA-degrading endonuclease YafQ of YafQ-DinJ toxin-antitoxin module
MIGDKEYKPKRSKFFEKDYASLVRKNKGLQERLDKKILQILGMPEAYKNLKRPLQRYKAAHVDPFVITFRIDGDYVRYVRVAHHDVIYWLPHD